MIRKILLIVIMISLIVLLGYSVYAGIDLGGIKISSYKNLDNKSHELKGLILEYEEKNSSELAQIEGKFAAQISEYKEQKQKYEEILRQKETDLINYDSANCYDIDFLWTKIGNFATEHGLILEFNISKNASDQGNEEFILTDLNFITMGSYDGMADFIEELEEDPKLEFEIRNFRMKNDKTKDKNDKEIIVLKSTFTVYGVAINKSTLTQLTSSGDTATENTAPGF